MRILIIALQPGLGDIQQKLRSRDERMSSCWILPVLLGSLGATKVAVRSRIKNIDMINVDQWPGTGGRGTMGVQIITTWVVGLCLSAQPHLREINMAR